MPFYGHGGLTKAELARLIRRNRFWTYLPYSAFDPEEGLYYNTDSTEGYIWECTPLYFLGKDKANNLEGILRLDLPSDTVLQFILYADDHIEPMLANYLAGKSRADEFMKDTAENYAEFLRKGTKGLPNTSGIPVRNFRLLVAVKFPGGKIPEQKRKQLKVTIFDILQGAGLAPRPFGAAELIGTLFRLFNDRNDSVVPYNDDIPIGKQIILAESAIKNHWGHLQMGNKYVKVTTPKVYPGETSLLAPNRSIGDIWGIACDSSQINTPFIMTYNIVFDESLKGYIENKCNMLLRQGAFGSFAVALNKKKEEFLQATSHIGDGGVFHRVLPVVTVIGHSEEEATASLVRTKRLFEQQNFLMQEDKGIIPILFMSSLPFGLYNQKGNLRTLDRDFILPAKGIAEMLPVQGDFVGTPGPAQFFLIGRKGQLIKQNVFDKKANNPHFFVAAESGAGKSFLMNFTALNYYAGGTIMRIIDIGGSYKKACSMMKGRYLEFTEESNICLNPFTVVKDVETDLTSIGAIVAQMVYSSSPHRMSETENTIIKDAVRWAYATEGTDAQIDTVHAYLSEYPRHAEDHSESLRHVAEAAHTMAFNLKDFTSSGSFGRWFNGKSTLDVSQDEFVVLELEHLKPKAELFKVVTLQVFNAISQDLYLTERGRQRMIIFDEVWQLIGDSEETRYLTDVIEGGYRRARKYGGSFGIVTQSILDIKKFGKVGDVILNNSAFHILPQSGDYAKAKQEKVINYNDFTMDLLQSVGSNRPKYTELFLKTPWGEGVGRLAVDRFSFYTYNSDADVNARIEKLHKEGLSYTEAINKLIEEDG